MLKHNEIIIKFLITDKIIVINYFSKFNILIPIQQEINEKNE